IALVQKVAHSLDESDLEKVEVAVLPPFTDIRSVQTVIDGDRLGLVYGAQDLSIHASGAYPGDVTGAMLAQPGGTYVIVGHSERRQHHGEDDALVAQKVAAALRHGLAPILCIGESLDVRREGRHVEHTLRQLDAALDGVKPEHATSVVV